jgi:3-deoxy-D-manno-octulosonic-acid transferase
MLTYRLLITLLSPFLLGHILYKAISNKHSRYFWQRLGFQLSALPKNSLWFHCASVGEVNTVLPLLKNLHDKNPQLTFIISTNTITGAKIVEQKNLDYLFHCYLPFDWSSSVKRFLDTAKPTALYVLETEIWPNLFAACSDKNINIHIINARLSKKTTDAANWIKQLLKTSLSHVSAISARSEQDAQRYITLGADEKTVHTKGNLKFTTALNKLHESNNQVFSIDREYVLLASTHEDEESQIYTRWKTLNRNELLIIAPRHPERASAICKKLKGTNIAIRSKQQAITEQTEVFLLDTVGELKNYFHNAKLVIMGGSFVAIGGHNILEPASENNGIITGPHMENFKQEMDLMLAQNAIVQVSSIDDLEIKLAALLDDEKQRQLLEKNTTQIFHAVETILDNYTQLILKR